MLSWLKDEYTGLPHLICFMIRGKDAKSFLHRQLTHHVLNMPENTAAYSSWCNPKGRVICDLLIAYEGSETVEPQGEQASDTYFLVTHHSHADVISKRMRMFVLRDDVQIQLLTDAALLGQHIAGHHPQTKADSAKVHEFALPWDPERKLTIVVTTEVAEKGANTATNQSDKSTQDSESQYLNADISTLERWRLLDIQSGVCWLPSHLSNEFLPQMLGLEKLNALSFDKGCYPGQEVIARTHYLGRVKRHISHLQMAKSVPETEVGSQIFNQQDEETGVVIAIANNHECAFGLGVIRENTDTAKLSIGKERHVISQVS